MALASFHIDHDPAGDIKRDYDANLPLEQALPKLAANYPERYGHLGLRDLCDLMFRAMNDLQTTEMMSRGFSTLPHPDYSPQEAFELLVHNQACGNGSDTCLRRVWLRERVCQEDSFPLLTGKQSRPAPAR